ncbi:MAG TPA: fumarylacetoacetate hydrolase family protein [Armatimonadota bacterium]|nr:fumarylacetoacetate hydrolase family protein [Armatimonadota bacterium]
MKVVRFAAKDIGRQSIGIPLDDGLLNFTEAFQAYQLFSEGTCACPVHSPMALMEMGLFSSDTFNKVLDFAKKHEMVGRFTVGDYKVLAPIERPSKILALGRNYVAHAKELGHPVPTEPVFFSKLSSAVIGPDEPVVYRKGLARVDHEVELAVVIGREGANIPASDAYSYVAGYTIVNDVTARDMQTADLKLSDPWTRSKGIDTFCPMGPCIVLPDEIRDPDNLELEMRVNGEVRQKDNTRSMLFKVREIISYISSFHTLLPGDVIATGTPEGISPVFPGDVMECYVEEIGVLRNPVAAEGRR